MSTRTRKLVARMLIVSLIITLVAIPGLRPKEAFADEIDIIAIKADINSRFITVDSSGALAATSTTANTSAELFERVMQSSNTYILRSKLTGKYVVRDTSVTPVKLKAAGTSPGDAEKFTFERANGFDYFKASNNNYVTAERDTSGVPLSVRTGTKGNWEKFTFSNNISRVLEITDSGESDLQAVLGGLANVTIETMSMKRFVALRGDLDGKYDVIYIGKGNYNPTLVGKLLSLSTSEREAKHDTKGLENDITQLKAKEIVDSFVRKGQLVYIYNDKSKKDGLLYQGYKTTDTKTNVTTFTPKTGILYATFAPYETVTRNNVKFITPSELNNLADQFTTGNELLYQKPSFFLTSQPETYTAETSKVHSPGERITFDFTMANYSDFGKGNLSANLYIGLDQAVKFKADQQVATAVVSSANGSISYVLPRGYSGLYYWKLEIVDSASELKSYDTGVIRFKDKTTNLRVLQIMPGSSIGSRLTLETNLKQSYLKNSALDYNISITSETFDTFKKRDMTALNGAFDMLIFGFGDSYNANSGITDTAAAAVRKFISTGQSVMFTHDTVYSSNGTRNIWIDSFQTDSGQIEPWTNMGFSAPAKSSTVTKVNDGLLTLYPYNLNNSTPAVAVTHNQYFTLDLEDPTVVPWYNITGSKRDTDDSWNHYYTYSKGSVTYTGSGHTSTGFADWEQRLFVNTMYRAFMGSNHAPELTVANPIKYTTESNNFIPSYQPIVINFTPEDYDFEDRNLTAEIRFYDASGNELTNLRIPEFTTPSGTAVQRTIQNPLPNGGDLKIEITVKDKTGAIARETIPVKVKVISSYLTVDRTVAGLLPNNRIEKNASAQITYTLTPRAIEKSPDIDTSTLKITNLSFREKLPVGLDVMGALPAGITIDRTTPNGYTLTGTRSNINYSLAANGSNFTASPDTFTITVTPTRNGAYTLNDSALTFTDVGAKTPLTLPFPVKSFEAITRATKIDIDDKELAKGDNYRVPVVTTPDDATTLLGWTSSNPSIATIDASTGYVLALASGTTTVTVTDAISGNSDKAVITVIERGLSISGPAKVSVGESIDLTSMLKVPKYETINAGSVTWSVFNPSNGTEGKGSLSGTGDWARTLRGEQTGTVKVMVSVTTTDTMTNDSSARIKRYDAEKDIEITPPGLGLAAITKPIAVGDQVPLEGLLKSTLGGLLGNNIISSVTWSLKGTDAGNKANFVNASTGSNLTNTLNATQAGDVTVVLNVKLLGGLVNTNILSAELPLTILNRVPDLGDPITIGAGNSPELPFTWSGAGGSPSFAYTPTWRIVGAESGSTAAITNNGTNSGKLTTTKADGGIMKAIVSIPTPAGPVLTAEKTINVVNLSLPALTMPQGTVKDLRKALTTVKEPLLQVVPSTLRTALIDKVKFSSDNTNIVYFSPDGDLIGKRAGTTTINVTLNDLNLTIKVKVTVTNTDKY
ncbi:DUF5057 domain-containing protein [Paenibacillus aurantiacus]|uniref:DUF5057 domain-containing protein n=1 Tax=Paenibacillus aurantiacus TaxID=1936118 RepID=A0ABV5KJZ0_9BACL